LTLEVGSNSIGVFARKLVKSATGRFNVKISAKPEPGIELFGRFRCLEIDKQLPVVNLALNNDYASLEKMKPTDCSWFMLEILAQSKLEGTTTLDISEIEVSSN
jgi:hypothetical protein